MPRTHGDGLIHISCIDHAVEVNDPLPVHDSENISDVEMAIGRNVASLIEDGSTLQMGIGAIPNATLACLEDHRRLGFDSFFLRLGLLKLAGEAGG
jgi:acyl-CoA hydrolase